MPTLPPDYEDNLINRLRAAQKGILPASLKMILNSDYQLPVLRSASQVSVQPDSAIGEHRVEQVSTASECDLSPRHAAVVTRSDELETPPKSPAISTGLHRPGVSPAFEADSPQTNESLFPSETSMEAFLNFNFISPEQECTFHQPDIGVQYSDEATSKLQAGAREESARPTIRQLRTTAWSTQQSKQFDRGRLKITTLISDLCLLHVVFLVLSFVFCLLSCFLLLYVFFSIMSENLPYQVQKEEQSRRVRWMICCINEHSLS